MDHRRLAMHPERTRQGRQETICLICLKTRHVSRRESEDVGFRLDMRQSRCRVLLGKEAFTSFHFLSRMSDVVSLRDQPPATPNRQPLTRPRGVLPPWRRVRSGNAYTDRCQPGTKPAMQRVGVAVSGCRRRHWRLSQFDLRSRLIRSWFEAEPGPGVGEPWNELIGVPAAFAHKKHPLLGGVHAPRCRRPGRR